MLIYQIFVARTKEAIKHLQRLVQSRNRTPHGIIGKSARSRRFSYASIGGEHQRRETSLVAQRHRGNLIGRNRVSQELIVQVRTGEKRIGCVVSPHLAPHGVRESADHRQLIAKRLNGLQRMG